MTTSSDSLTSRIVLALMDEKKRLRPKDLEVEGIPGEYLWLLAKEGRIRKLGRGLYAALDWHEGDHQALLEACAKVPTAVVCLLSALHFYQLLESAPDQVWLALAPGSYRPKVENLKYSQFLAEGFSQGLEVHQIAGAPLRIYSLSRTVADCFRFRNKIGIETALGALKQALGRGCSEAEILTYARITRVEKVLEPYLLALKA
jgi:predicted transcriptional regulator of viral defense system